MDFCHLFLISSASVLPLLSFILPISTWNVPLVSLVFLKRSLVFPNEITEEWIWVEQKGRARTKVSPEHYCGKRLGGGASLAVQWLRLCAKAMTPHSSTLAWKIPWMEEPDRLQSMGSLRVRHDWATSLSLFTFMHWRRKWQSTPSVLAWRIPGTGEPGGLPSLGSHRVGHDWSDLAAAAASTADDVGLIPGWELRSHIPCSVAKKKKSDGEGRSQQRRLRRCDQWDRKKAKWVWWSWSQERKMQHVGGERWIGFNATDQSRKMRSENSPWGLAMCMSTRILTSSFRVVMEVRALFEWL